MTRADSGNHANAKAEEKSATSASIADAMHPHPPQTQRNERRRQQGERGHAGRCHHNHHHIRPRLRNAKAKKTRNTASDHPCPLDDEKGEDIDAMVERTRRRMQGLGVLDAKASPVMAMTAATAGTPTTHTSSEQVNQHHPQSGVAVQSGIGGSPRSTIGAEAKCGSDGGGGNGSGKGILKKHEECRYQQQRPPPSGHRGDNNSTSTLDSSSFLKDEVVERRVPRPDAVEAEDEAVCGPAAPSPVLTSSVEVAGYAPSSTPTSMRETSFAAEGKTGVAREGMAEMDADFKQMEIEDVDVTFACMSPEEYDETLRYAKEMEKMDKEHHGGRGSDNNDDKEEKLAARIGGMQIGNDGDSDSDQIVIGHDIFPADDDEEDEEDRGVRSNKDGLEPKRDGESVGNEDDDDNDNGTRNESCALDLLGMGSDEDDEEAISEEPSPRAFMELWKALSTWVTPEACRVVRHWRQTSAAAPADDDDADMDRPCSDEGDCTNGREMDEELYVQVDRTDVGSSRCGGLMAMLRLHLTHSLRELGAVPGGRLDHDVEDSSDVDMEGGQHGRRWVEDRLGGLVRSFDYSRPMVDFAPSMWRAMTVVLTSIAIQGGGNGGSAMNVDSPSVLPESLKEVGLTIEEYRYLSLSAIPSLDKGT